MSMWIIWILFIFITYITMELTFLFRFYPGPLNLKNIQQQVLPLIIAYFYPNIDFIFIYQLFRYTFIHSLSSNIYWFWFIFTETMISNIHTFHWTKNPNTSKMEYQFLYCGNIHFFVKDINNFLTKKETFLCRNFTLLIFVFYSIT